MASDYIKKLKCGRKIEVWKQSFRVDGEGDQFFLKQPVPRDFIIMLVDLLDDVYEQGKSDRAKELKQLLEIE